MRFGGNRRPPMPPPRMAARQMAGGKAGPDQAPPGLKYVPPTSGASAAEQELARRMVQSKTYTPSTGKVDVPQGEIPDNFSVVPTTPPPGTLKPGAPLPMKKGGKVKSKPKAQASKRGDGLAQRGKTKGRFV